MIEVEPRMCPQNHPCPVVRLCPTGAISQRGYAAPEVDGDECVDCGMCAQACRAFRHEARYPLRERLPAGV